MQELCNNYVAGYACISPAVPLTEVYSVITSNIRLSSGGGLVITMQISTKPLASLTEYRSCSNPTITAENYMPIELENNDIRKSKSLQSLSIMFIKVFIERFVGVSKVGNPLLASALAWKVSVPSGRVSWFRKKGNVTFCNSGGKSMMVNTIPGGPML